MSESLKIAELVKNIFTASVNAAKSAFLKGCEGLLKLKNEFAQRFDYYKYVARQYAEFYGRKENQDILKKNLKDYSQYLLEKQKYKFNQKKELIIDKYKYEKYKFLRRLDQSRDEFSYRASELKNRAERTLEKIGY